MADEIQVLSLKYSKSPPSQEEALDEFARIVEQYADLEPLLHMIRDGSSDDRIVFKPGAFVDADFLDKAPIERVLREQFPEGKAFADFNILSRILTVINFPQAGETSLITLGVGGDGSHVDGLLETRTSTHPTYTVAGSLGKRDEIRYLLAGEARRRRALLIAGSPGWDSNNRLGVTGSEIHDKQK